MSERILDALRRTLGENLRFAAIALRAHKLRAFLTIVTSGRSPRRPRTR